MAETEQDPDKFLQLHKEIVQLLGAKEERLTGKGKPGSGRTPSLVMDTESQKRIKDLSRQLLEEKNEQKFTDLVQELSAFLEKQVPLRAPTKS